MNNIPDWAKNEFERMDEEEVELLDEGEPDSNNE